MRRPILNPFLPRLSRCDRTSGRGQRSSTACDGWAPNSVWFDRPAIKSDVKRAARQRRTIVPPAAAFRKTARTRPAATDSMPMKTDANIVPLSPTRSCKAAAAGTANKADTRRTPTTCMAKTIVIAVRTVKPVSRARTGRPLTRAPSGSKEEEELLVQDRQHEDRRGEQDDDQGDIGPRHGEDLTEEEGEDLHVEPSDHADHDDASAESRGLDDGQGQ